ncbi:MAG: hypothetical protein JNL85_05025 [Rubrivivax sp.]|nr:hypothetical protein [Rubrivivax sp.]
MTTSGPPDPEAAAAPGPLPGCDVHGYAIVSADGMIADRDGAMPAALRNEADWVYFQAQLDLADLVLLGRKSHELAPNPRRRRRLVASASVASLEERLDAWWWNPAAMPLRRVLATLLPGGGRVAVPGGQGVFDMLVALAAFDHFHLACATGVRLPQGLPIFSDLARGATAASVLARAGLSPRRVVTLDPVAPVAPVVLTLWERAITLPTGERRPS